MKNITTIKNSFIHVSNHFSDFLKSIVFLQTIRGLIAFPTMSFLFYELLKVAKLNGITNSNILTILSNPIALLLGIILILLSVFFVFYELGYYFLLGHHQMKGEGYTFRSIAKELNQKAKYFLSIHSILFALYFLLILPVVSLGIHPELTKNIKIPNFIVDELLMSTSGKALYYCVILLFTYIGLRLIYSILFFVIEKDISIWEAIKKSWLFSKGRSLSTLILLGLLLVSYGAILVVPVTVSFLPLFLSERLLPILSPVIAGLTISVVQLYVFFVSGLLQPLLSVALIETTNEPIQKFQRKPWGRLPIKQWFQRHIVLGSLFVVAVIGVIGVNVWSVMTVVYKPTTNIIAHRGFMEKGVENSKGALRGASNAKADYSELDIQETKDGQFAVIHDFNLNRLAGVNEAVADLTMAELKELRIKQNGFEDTIPTLEEYIDQAKQEGIKLLIEIKPHGKESKDMIKNFAALLKEKKVDEEYLVQSLEKDVLDELKEVAPQIRTGYIVPLNIGKLPEMKHDFIVLEDFSVTEAMIEEAHEKHVAVFVWTINEDDLLKKYLRTSIDGIITNHPDRAIQFRESTEETKTLLNRVQFILEN